MDIRHMAMAMACTAALAVPAARAEQTIDRSVATGASPSVEVSNVQGRVTINGWDRNEVKVTGTLENDKHELEFSGDEKHVVIKVRADKDTHGFGRHDDALLNISVPTNARLEVQTVSAEIDVNGVTGEQRLASVSGDVTTVAASEPIDVRTISGDIKLTGSGGNAAVYAETTSGDVVALDLGPSLEAKTVSGDLDIAMVTASTLRLETVSGDLTTHLMLAEGARIDARSVSGDVTLNFSRPVNADFDLETFSGDINNCFGPAAVRRSKYSPGSELRFTQGSGGGRVSVKTLSGDASICDH